MSARADEYRLNYKCLEQLPIVVKLRRANEKLRHENRMLNRILVRLGEQLADRHEPSERDLDEAFCQTEIEPSLLGSFVRVKKEKGAAPSKETDKTIQLDETVGPIDVSSEAGDEDGDDEDVVLLEQLDNCKPNIVYELIDTTTATSNEEADASSEADGACETVEEDEEEADDACETVKEAEEEADDSCETVEEGDEEVEEGDEEEEEEGEEADGACETVEEDEEVEGEEVEGACETVEEVEEGEEEEAEVFEITIQGKTYFTTDAQNGDIYAMDDQGDVGDEIGVFVNGVAKFNKKTA